MQLGEAVFAHCHFPRLSIEVLEYTKAISANRRVSHGFVGLSAW